MDSSHRAAAASLVCLLIGFAGPVGCDSASPADPVETPPPPPPTAEERFDNFLSTLKRKVQDPEIRDGAAVANLGSEPGTPMTDWSTIVDHEYFKAEGDNPAKAVVTLTTRSTVTVVMPPEPTQAESAAKKRSVGGAAPEGYAEIEAIVTVPSGARGGQRGSSIQTLPDEEVIVLELEFQGDAWVLLTELDDANAPFTSAAIRYALNRQ